MEHSRMGSAEDLRKLAQAMQKFAIPPTICRECGRGFYYSGRVWPGPSLENCMSHIPSELVVAFVQTAKARMN